MVGVALPWYDEQLIRRDFLLKLVIIDEEIQSKEKIIASIGDQR